MLTLKPNNPNTDMIEFLVAALMSNNRQVAAMIAKESLACGDTDSFNQLHYEVGIFLMVLFCLQVIKHCQEALRNSNHDPHLMVNSTSASIGNYYLVELVIKFRNFGNRSIFYGHNSVDESHSSS